MCFGIFLFEFHGDLDGEQVEKRGELDDGVHRDRDGVLERVARPRWRRSRTGL